MFKIGCHLSISKGFLAMAKNAVSINANTFQFFTRNPRGGSAKALDMDDIKAFLEYTKQHNFATVLAHAPYTLNASAAKDSIREFTQNTIADDLQRMEYIPDSYYNFHPGNYGDFELEEAIDFIAGMLNKVLWKEQTTLVLLETMSGKGTEVGRTFEEIRTIIDKVELKDKLGVCLDTCHVYSAGYDIVNDLDAVLDNFDEIIGLQRLKAIHLNDSKNPFNSHKDRHETIGNGSIGIDAFKNIINHPKLRNLPFYLETPNELEGYGKEIELLRSLYRD